MKNITKYFHCYPILILPYKSSTKYKKKTTNILIQQADSVMKKRKPQSHCENLYRLKFLHIDTINLTVNSYIEVPLPKRWSPI